MHPYSKVSASPTTDWPSLAQTARAEARRWLRCPHDVEDAAQEALLRAWNRRDSCGLPDARPWVRQIARREAWRLMTRERTTAERELRAANPERGATDELALVDLRADLQQALGQLSASDRALVVARYALDLTQPAAAALIGLPEGTAKTRLHRLRKKLAEAL